MMNFWVEGANRESGQPFRGVVKAKGIKHAEEIANANGILVTSVAAHTQAVSQAIRNANDQGKNATGKEVVVRLDRESMKNLVAAIAVGVVLSHALAAFIFFAIIRTLIEIGRAVGTP